MPFHLDTMSLQTLLLILIFSGIIILIVVLLIRNEQCPVKHTGPTFLTSNTTEVRKEVIPPAQITEDYSHHYYMKKGEVEETFEYCTRCGKPLKDRSMPFHDICPISPSPSSQPQPRMAPRIITPEPEKKTETKVESKVSTTLVETEAAKQRREIDEARSLRSEQLTRERVIEEPPGNIALRKDEEKKKETSTTTTTTRRGDNKTQDSLKEGEKE